VRPKVTGENPASVTMEPFCNTTWKRPVIVVPVVLCVLTVSGIWLCVPRMLVLPRAVFSTWRTV
jgi:hypothetical protein